MTQANDYKDINEEIEKAAPPFDPAHALTALRNTNVYPFRYFPRLKMIVLTERLCRDFHLQPVYRDMPYSFSKDFVAEEDRPKFEKMYQDIDRGIPSSSVHFRGKGRITWYHVTLTVVEWNEDHEPELCTGIVENRSKEENIREELNNILSSISCGILQYRKSDNALIRTNRAALDILGYDSMEELNRDRECGIAKTVLPEDRIQVSRLVNSLQAPGDVRTIEYRVRHKGSDQIRYCYGTVQIYNDIHKEVYVLRTIMDITDRKLREDMQQTNAELLTMQRQMVKSLSCGVLAYTLPQRKILISNKETQRIFRYNSSDPRPLMDAVYDHILPQDRAVIHKAVKRLKAVGDSCSYKLHPLMENGKRLTVECKTKLRAFADGQRFILSVLSDITESEQKTNDLNTMNAALKEMISEIRKERQQYRDALVSGSEYSYRFDVTDGIVPSDFDYSIRGGMKENLGLTPPILFDEMVQRWRNVMKPKFLTPRKQNPMTAAEVQACYDQGLKYIVTEYFNETEQKYYRRTFLLSRDEETGHLWAIAIITDITGTIREETRKRNELAMINRDLRNQIGISKAFSSIYFLSWEVNLETGQIIGISIPKWAADAQKLAEDDFEKAVKIMAPVFVKEESRSAFRQFVRIDDMAERLKNESILSRDYQSMHYGWATVCLIPSMRDKEGNVLRVIFAIREIDKEKRIEAEAKQALEEAYEAANRANATKTDFLSSMSHDIRTPMNGIIGMTAIATTHLDDKERVADCLSKISISSKHLLGLINEVLDMNKIESGKLDLNAEEFSLSELLETLMTMSKPQIEHKKHNFFVNVQNVEHEKVVGDSLRIQQVFMNLLSNSIKYTPEGGVIKLSLSEMPTNNPKIGCYEFVIEDNGIGMSREFQKRLFEPFSRAKDTRVEKIQGSGLGMPIARNIIRMMNGDIRVESELSKGTRFIVTMYLELQDSDSDISIAEFSGLPVLVADDDLMVCESAHAMLKELGMQCEWVLTGQEAIEKTADRHQRGRDYFAVLLDWKMPGMDGVKTVREIRKQIGEDLFIIIISAYDWSDIEQEAMAAGVNAFISKPLFKSRITYLFKRLLGDEQEQETHSSTEKLSDKDYRGKRALLAEDNELNAEIAGELLGITGLEIEYARNGKEAVDLVTDHPKNYYDIIFMDVQMPIMNGYEATRAIRSLPGAYEKRVPIIAMTANAFAEDVQTAKSVGMNEHVAKPLDIEQLARTLKHWLE